MRRTKQICMCFLSLCVVVFLSACGASEPRIEAKGQVIVTGGVGGGAGK